MGFTPCGLEIPGPIVTPTKYGLFSVVSPITPEDGHWEGGVTWDEDYCSSVFSTVGFCPIPVTGSTPKIDDRSFDSCCADPFIVYSSFDCPPVGRTAREAFDIAKNRLSIREEKTVESVFWTGITDGGMNVNPSLAFGNSTCGGAPVNLTPSGGPVGVVASMAVLESALGENSPGTGVIHMNYGLASFLAANYLIFRDENGWHTVTGQRLAIGAGYPGTGPNNVATTAGTTWVFATGPLFIARSETFLTPERYQEALDRTLNNVTVYAERVFSLGWSCCLFAIQVSLC